MRPSKLRLPLSIAHATRLPCLIAPAIASSTGPLLPIHVVHPYPTRLKRSFSSDSIRPARFRYWVTTFEPGARLVFTHGLTVSPRATAFFARIPAASITDGFEVLVQLVIAAITIEPWVSGNLPASECTSTLCAIWPSFA